VEHPKIEAHAMSNNVKYHKSVELT